MRDIRYQIAIDRQPDNGLTEEASEIEVQQSIEGPTTFRVRLAVDICGVDFSLLEDERLNPGNPDTEVTITALLNGETSVLVHGIITERQVNLTEGGPGSWLEIRGQDRRAAMNREERCESHSGRASDIVQQILGRYGFETDVADTEIEYEENTHTINQTQTDLAFVDMLAGRSDSRFWIDWEARTGLTGFEVTETAHFRPSPERPEANALGFAPPVLLAPDDAPELTLNSGDGCSNLASFELSSNAEAPNQSGPVQRVNNSTGRVDDTEVPGPTTESLGGDAAPGQARTRRVVSAGNAQEARLRNQAALNDASWSVAATAETSPHALKGFVAPHQVVRVTGGGRLNSGNYFVKSVGHAIDSANHKLKIELLRNALGAS